MDIRHKVFLLGVAYANLKQEEALNEVSFLMEKHGRYNVFFLNADCLRQSRRDPEYRAILNNADLLLSDGIGLRLATRLFGGRMRDNCNGTDLSPRILELAARKGYKVFFLGGKPGVAERAAENMRQRLPGLQMVGTHPGYFLDAPSVVEMINASGADILFVAMGVPAQEKWIAGHRSQLTPKVCLGVGALLDYLSGTLPRAPLWMRRMHIEWLWRVFVDPKRMIKRYLIDGVCFLIYLLWVRIISCLAPVIPWPRRNTPGQASGQPRGD